MPPPSGLSTASCPANIKHSNLQLPRDSGGSTSHTVVDSEGKGLQETTIRLQKIFLGEHAPQTTLPHFALNACAKSCTGCAHHMAVPNSLYVCPPPLPSSIPGSAPDTPLHMTMLNFFCLSQGRGTTQCKHFSCLDACMFVLLINRPTLLCMCNLYSKRLPYLTHLLQ